MTDDDHAEPPSKLPQLLVEYDQELLSRWLEVQESDLVPTDAMNSAMLRKHSAEFLHLLRTVVTETRSFVPDETPPWRAVRELLARVSREHARQGARPHETALYVLALKKPVFDLLLPMHGANLAGLHRDLWLVSFLLDQLGLYVTEVQARERDSIIEQQRNEMLELSTPVVELWNGIVLAPLIGTLDSRRAQSVTEALLDGAVNRLVEIAIIDITGVPTVDTMVAQHLIKTATALRLMGVECVISGIRPAIALTMVQLGIELGDLRTRATIADAFRDALRRVGTRVIQSSEESA